MVTEIKNGFISREDKEAQRIALVNKGLINRKMVDMLRTWSKDPALKDETVIIPDDCEKHGFAEGEHNVAEMLHFLADMLE